MQGQTVKLMICNIFIYASKALEDYSFFIHAQYSSWRIQLVAFECDPFKSLQLPATGQ